MAMLHFPDRDLPPDHPDRRLLGAIAGGLDVAPDRVALADTLAEFIRSALTARPQVRDAERQAALTTRFLTPALPALERLLLMLRAELDPLQRELRPSRNGKPYPLGQCLEITRAVRRRLDDPDPAELSGPAAEAWAALAAFRIAGGEVRCAWGDLRGEYFQNALIVGTLYVDVSNDTVVATKPPVQILPFVEADFRPVTDHLQFAAIAQRYWGKRFLPNHLLPELAPYLPMIEVGPTGALSIGPSSRYLLALTLANRFGPSEQALAAAPLPAATFDSFSRLLRGGPAAVAENAAHGREAALARCRGYRSEGRFDCAASFNQAMIVSRAVNRRLAGFMAVERV